MMLVTRPSSFILVLCFVFDVFVAFGQTSAIQKVKHKNKLLRGQWQLVKTFTDKKFHDIDKSEYDAIIRIKCCHRFEEEVWYEGYHWIIAGKWKTKRNTDSLCFYKRQYTYGKLEEKPNDIRYTLSEIDRKNWVGDSEAEGEKVRLFYRKIEMVKRKKQH